MTHFHHEVEMLILEISGIFFFLYVAMIYIEAMIDRHVFMKLRYTLISKGYNYKQLFWVSGLLAFFISPIADNLTTALILSTVLITMDKENHLFLVPSAINTDIGGSLISFGSAAGVGVMGKLHGIYTFTTHMKFAWTVLVGYVVSLIVWYCQFEILGIG